MTKLFETARALGFQSWHTTAQRASIADLYRPPHRCGIYILGFGDGEAYAGQAVDVTRRYVQHRQTHGDIERISFKPIPRAKLSDEERRVIHALEAAGIALRNISLASIPHGPSDLDLVMPADEQERWLADLSMVEDVGPRSQDPEARRRYARRYQRFLYRPHATGAIGVIRAYVRAGIPAYARSEMTFWGCSCLPSYSARGETVYSRINLYLQEVFTVAEWNGRLDFTWHLARSPLEGQYGPSLRRLRRRHRGLKVWNEAYQPGGQDQVALRITGPDAALEVLQDPDIVAAVRLFNLRLMRKGPSMYGRYHCFDLADHVYEPAPPPVEITRQRGGVREAIMALIPGKARRPDTGRAQ